MLEQSTSFLVNMQKENYQNLKVCPRFNQCSANICPLEPEANLRNKLPNESLCPFCLKKKATFQRGIRTLAPASVLAVVPESNVKMLNRRNQKRRHDLYKVYDKQ
jgi:hypothetical protein